MKLDHPKILLIMKQVNKSFDTVKVFRDIKTKLSKKLIVMKDEEITNYLSKYDEDYYTNSIAESRLKYNGIFDEMSISEFAKYLSYEAHLLESINELNTGKTKKIDLKDLWK